MDSFCRIIFFQLLSLLIVVIVAWAVWSNGVAFSALLGGGSCAIPSIMATLTMKVIVKRMNNPLAFFLVEIFKVTGTIFLLLLVALIYKGLHWPAFLIGCGVVLFSHLFALAYRR